MIFDGVASKGTLRENEIRYYKFYSYIQEDNIVIDFNVQMGEIQVLISVFKPEGDD